jgi:DNA-binding response OmpR family regulator
MSVQPNWATWQNESVVRPSSRHILVVDDDPSVVRLLKENLEQEGYHVTCAYDGDAALHQIRSQIFNLMILDIRMPLTNGLQVLQHLRASADTVRLPVIFVTGEPSGDVYPAVAKDPRAAHIKKPLDLDSFNTVVRHFLERYPYP